MERQGGVLSPADLVARAREVVEREARSVAALAGQLEEGLAAILAALLACRGHVLVTGAGTSHAMAQRFAHLLSCCGVPALCIHAADSLHGSAGAIREEDVVFVISKGGRSSEINEFVAIAKSRGATVIAQTEDPQAPLALQSDMVYTIRAVGDIDPYGMVALGSSLVNGAAGDVLCALALEVGGYSKEAFGLTHPGGAVGIKLQKEVGEEK
jgi:arabinose-5-phosphate isomerase